MPGTIARSGEPCSCGRNSSFILYASSEPGRIAKSKGIPTEYPSAHRNTTDFASGVTPALVKTSASGTPDHLALLISAPGGLIVLLTHSRVAYSSLAGIARRCSLSMVSGELTSPDTFKAQRTTVGCA